MTDAVVVVALAVLVGASIYAITRDSPTEQAPKKPAYTTEIYQWPEGTHDATRDNYQWPVPMHAAVGWQRS